MHDIWVEATGFPPLQSSGTIAFIFPWTRFREDGDFTSIDAIRAALNAKQSLCAAGDGFDIFPHFKQATNIGVWRDPTHFVCDTK